MPASNFRHCDASAATASGGGICGAALTSALAVASISGSLSIAVLCVAHVLMELRGGYFGTVTNAALKDVVHTKQLGRAMAANQGRDSVLMLGAAPLGGLLLGLGAAFALFAVSFLQLLAAASGFALRGPLRAAEANSNPVENSPAGSAPVSPGIAAGMRWCFARPQLRSLLILITVINIGTNGLNTTLIYGLQQRGETPWVIGLVSTFMGLGMFAGSLFAGRLIEKFRTGVLACSCLSVLGGAMLLMGFNTNLIWLGAMLLIAYLSVPALNASVGGYFMAVVPREMAGRANSLILFMALSALPLAPFLTGLGLQWLGMGPTLLFFSSLVIVATVAAWCSRHVRGIPHPDHWTSEPASANSQIEVEAKESAGLVSAEDEPTQVQGEPSMKTIQHQGCQFLPGGLACAASPAVNSATITRRAVSIKSSVPSVSAICLRRAMSNGSTCKCYVGIRQSFLPGFHSTGACAFLAIHSQAKQSLSGYWQGVFCLIIRGHRPLGWSYEQVGPADHQRDHPRRA